MTNFRPIQHGTRAGYQRGCHASSSCPASPSCAEMHRRYHGAYRAKLAPPPPTHGVQLEIPASAYVTVGR